ncbi:NAD(P)H-dependent flavin oxidoreductase [Pseudomonas sp. NCHU5208]|uniref:NAD(P)H-dependent flavin oxidoreductase n=1 Tax=unclassified Pseudomonas TaxID=196821 RepID=UPI003F9AA8B8
MSVNDLFGTDLALIQAPMAGSQNHRLAAAVCQAGGLGSIPCAMLTPAALGQELEAIKNLTTAPFNLNFFSHIPPEPDAAREVTWREALAPYYDELGVDVANIASGPGRLPFNDEAAALVEEFRPAVVSFHFGLPEENLLERVRRSGAKIISSATTLEEALWLQARGVDAVIAQGLEAGGHRGHFLDHELSRQLGTFALLPQLVDALSVPVIAAGGIADARGVAAAMALGATGVQVGSAYLLCPEASTSPLHRAALQSPAARHTALTNLFSGRPARGIVNRLIRELGPLSTQGPEFPLATAAIAPLRAAAEAKGSGDFSPLWAGQNVANCRPMPAAELTRELARGFRRA